MIAAALTIYATLVLPLVALAMCAFIAGARSDEKQGQHQAASEGAGFDGFHTQIDTRKGL